MQRLLQTLGVADGSAPDDDDEVELAFEVLLGDELVEVLVGDELLEVLVADEFGRHCCAKKRQTLTHDDGKEGRRRTE